MSSERSDGAGSDPDPAQKRAEWGALEAEWDCITRRARSRFLEEWDRREHWANFESRYHVYKAQDQLSVASYHARQADRHSDTAELVKVNIADAVNHMLMALATIDIDNDECEPITHDQLADFGGGRHE